MLQVSASCCSAQYRRVSTAPTVAPSPADLEPVARDSRVAAARGGTLFLQDVTELPAAIQARLARIARDGEVLLDGAPVHRSAPGRQRVTGR